MSTTVMPLNALIARRDAAGFKGLSPFGVNGIHAIAKRILRDGLLNPLIVIPLSGAKSGTQFIVVDGVKRLRALKALAKAGRLPRSLTQIPVAISPTPDAVPVSSLRPVLLSDAELSRAIQVAYQEGQTCYAIAERFDCSEAVVSYALSFDNLNPQIRDYFESGHISLEQAAAFASLENPDAQWRLLQELGPFAHAKEVIAAILSGQSVIEIPDGNVMIMPSRRQDFTTTTRRHAA